MSAPKSCLLYHNRAAAVLALREMGLHHRKNADSIGVTHAAASALATSGKRRATRSAEANSRTVLLAADLDRPRPHAIIRGISCNELAWPIVEFAVEQQKIDTILADDTSVKESTAP